MVVMVVVVAQVVEVVHNYGYLYCHYYVLLSDYRQILNIMCRRSRRRARRRRPSKVCHLMLRVRALGRRVPRTSATMVASSRTMFLIIRNGMIPATNVCIMSACFLASSRL